jgi:hypothetical protein
MNELRSLLEKWPVVDRDMMVCWPQDGGFFAVRTGMDSTALIWPEMMTRSTTQALTTAIDAAADCRLIGELLDNIMEATNPVDPTARLKVYLLLAEYQDREEYDAEVAGHGHANGYGQA